MKHTQGARKASVKQKVIVAAVASACATGAFAIELDMPDGWRGSINTTLSVSSTWRAQAADKALLNNVNAAQRDAGRAGLASSLTGSPLPAQYLRAGYTAGAADDYNLNYDKGDQVSEQYKVLSEFTFTNGDSGGLFRVKVGMTMP
ncbi:MAG: DUF1302 family protein [Rhodocyclaceae bacterium]|nr:DUF1302 family protein [Rhodocyclaceae bacterium]